MMDAERCWIYPKVRCAWLSLADNGNGTYEKHISSTAELDPYHYFLDKVCVSRLRGKLTAFYVSRDLGVAKDNDKAVEIMDRLKEALE